MFRSFPLRTAFFLAAAASGSHAAAQPVEVTGFGSNPGGLRMFVAAPEAAAGPRPLVLVLHG